MAHKCTCDICGADASQDEFIVPFVNTYYAMRNGVKLSSFDRIEPCNFNLCFKHYCEIAKVLKSMYDKNTKSERNEG